MKTVMRKPQSNSFAARLTAAQREELFDALAAGLGYRAAAVKISDWISANDAAGLNGDQPGREIPPPSAATLSKWYRGRAAQRRYEPAGVGRRQGLKTAEIVALEKLELARAKFEFERENEAYQRSRDQLLEDARVLLERATRDKSAELKLQIKLALEEIEKMKRGEV